MEDIDKYYLQMRYTMNMKEKLFFLDYIDVYNYDTIIDFGGADGFLLKRLQMKFSLLPSQCKFIIVDNNSQIKTNFMLFNFERVSSLDEITDLSGKILFICSSVLHECSWEDVCKISFFCEKYVQTIVMRDMAYQKERFLPKKDDNTKRALEAISSNPDYADRFQEVANYCKQWGASTREAVTQFILKCDYKENWEKEVKENYFSNNVINLQSLLCIFDGFKTVYKCGYPLPYKKEQAEKEFDFYLPNTHIKLILEKDELHKSNCAVENEV